jgi:hypothetical protein
MMRRPSSPFPGRGAVAGLALAVAAAGLLLAGCAGMPVAPADAAPSVVGAAATPATSSAAKPAAAATSPAAAAPQPGQPRAFADVVKDAKEMPGLFRVWQKDDKTWLEIAPDQFDRLYFFAATLSRGLGEKWLFGGLRIDSDVVSFRRIGNQVQLVARNQRYFAKPATPEARAVEEAFSDSLLASAPVVSQPHPERKSVLIEASALLIADIPGLNGWLEQQFRQPYSFDARNSAITLVRATPEQTSFNVSANYALARVVQPPPTPGATPHTLPPSTVPDVRSLLLGVYYSFAKLPDEPMRPRAADDRLGYLTTSRFDYSHDNTISPKVTYVRRWRIEKKDPAAEVSDAKQPVVFWLDRNIPERYRETVIAGVLEWNKAFERIGIRGALEARLQPEDADWETLDVRHASIRWMTTARPLFGGVAQSLVDPRTGEILSAGIGIDPVRIRNRRFQRVEAVPPPIAPAGLGLQAELACHRADFAAQELGFTLDLLEARGVVEPDSPEAEEFARNDLKETVMHEVGHALGLTHNFRASTIYTRAQLADLEFTRVNGIAGSVMEYNPANIALAGERQGAFNMMTLGPYDYWVIDYGYRPLAPEQEAAELARIAGRSSEPLLAFAQDQETSAGLDPDATQGDLGSDPLEFASRRLALARELWDRWQARPLKDGESYAALRRNLTRGLEQVRTSSAIAARHIGGLTVLRDHAGSPRAPLTPVPAQKQRAALALLEVGVFSTDSFRFKPEFLRRLGIDHLDREEMNFDAGVDGLPRSYDYSLPSQVLAVQRDVLNRLLSETVAQRLLDSEASVDDPTQALRLAELYGSLHRAIWVELKTGRDIPLLRRNLQREHATRIATALLKPSASMPADARALLRAQAKSLRVEVAAAQARPGLSPEAKAHLEETAAALDEALKAPLVRQVV